MLISEVPAQDRVLASPDRRPLFIVLTVALGIVIVMQALAVGIAGPDGSAGMLIAGPVAGTELFPFLGLVGCAIIAVGCARSRCRASGCGCSRPYARSR